jgi:transcriptional regulator with XRE-family HTH domain
MNEHLLTQAALIARFRTIRQARGMSQQDLADASGLHRTTVVKLELGKRESLSIDEARTIADALNVDLIACLHDGPVELRTVVA